MKSSCNHSREHFVYPLCCFRFYNQVKVFVIQDNARSCFSRWVMALMGCCISRRRGKHRHIQSIQDANSHGKNQGKTEVFAVKDTYGNQENQAITHDHFPFKKVWECRPSGKAPTVDQL